MMKSILLSISAIALVSVSAMAGPTITIKRQTKVAYSDLDLNSQTGVAVLLDRLHVASKVVCGHAPTASDSAFDTKAYETCTSNAFSNAVAKLGSKLPAEYQTASN